MPGSCVRWVTKKRFRQWFHRKLYKRYRWATGCSGFYTKGRPLVKSNLICPSDKLSWHPGCPVLNINLYDTRKFLYQPRKWLFLRLAFNTRLRLFGQPARKLSVDPWTAERDGHFEIKLTIFTLPLSSNITIIVQHYNDVTWAPRRLNSPAPWLFDSLFRLTTKQYKSRIMGGFPHKIPVMWISKVLIVSHPDDWWPMHCKRHLDDLAGFGISSGIVSAVSLCHPNDIPFHLIMVIQMT